MLTVWVAAPFEVTLDRLARHRGRKVQVSAQDARWIHAEAMRRAAARSFTAVVDTSATPDAAVLDELVTHLHHCA